MKTIFFKENALEIENMISEKLSKVWDYAIDSSPTEWTKAINIILSEVAKDNDKKHFVASKLKSSENPEWLYDLVWYDNNQYGLNNVLLIMESEWKNPFGNEDYAYDIQYDFEKLILGRSKYRLMIFEGDNSAENVSNLGLLKLVVANCQLSMPSDRYMFAAWDVEKQEFYFDLYIV